MQPFKLSASFYIIFTAIAIVPATWVARLLQDTIEHSSGTFLQSLAGSRIIEAPSTVVLIGLLFWLYKTYLWRIWLICMIHGVPYIAGRYEGHVESSYDSQKYPIFLEIRQTLTSVVVCLYTERSSSYSIMASIGKNENQNYFVAYAYKNTPRTVGDNLDMRTHDGFSCLEIFTTESKLEGYYYDDPRERSRHGKLACKLVSNKLKGHF